MQTQTKIAREEESRLGSSEPRSALERSLLVGIAWTGAVKWGAQLLSWASTLVVARLLTPADYGLLGMATVYLGLVALINELGLGAAILQRRELTEEQIASLGGLSLLFGTGLCLLSIGLAYPISSFYHAPAVRGIIMLLSVNFIMGALGVLPRALLARSLEFPKLAWADGAGQLTQMLCTLTLALLGFRYWSLVVGSIAGSAAATVATLSWRRHRLAWPRAIHTIAGAVQMGGQVLVGRIAWYSYMNADFAVVGRVLKANALGAYTLGWTIATVPVERISALVSQVTPGVFATLQHDHAALRRYYLGIVEGLAFLTFPATVGIALTADLFVPIVLGEQWRAAILPLRLLALYAGVRSIDTLQSQILVYTGNARYSMRYSVMIACVLPPLFYLATRWGTGAVAAVWIVCYPVLVIPAYRRIFGILDMTFGRYLRALWPALSGTLVMSFFVLASRVLLVDRLDSRVLLAACVVAGALAYAATIWAFHRERVRSFRLTVRRAREGIQP